MEEHLHFLNDEEIFLFQEKSQAPDLPEDIINPLIVLTQPLEPEQKELLEKILAAVNIDLAEVKILETKNVDSQPGECDKMLVFGDFRLEGMDGPKYECNAQSKYLNAAPLSIIANSKEEKTKLWQSLRVWFDIH